MPGVRRSLRVKLERNSRNGMAGMNGESSPARSKTWPPAARWAGIVGLVAWVLAVAFTAAAALKVERLPPAALVTLSGGGPIALAVALGPRRVRTFYVLLTLGLALEIVAMVLWAGRPR